MTSFKFLTTFIVALAIPLFASGIDLRVIVEKKPYKVVSAEDNLPVIEIDGKRQRVENPEYGFGRESKKARYVFWEQRKLKVNFSKHPSGKGYTASISGHYLLNLDIEDCWFFCIWAMPKNTQTYSIHSSESITGGKWGELNLSTFLENKPASREPKISLFSSHDVIGFRRPSDTQQVTFTAPPTPKRIPGKSDSLPYIAKFVKPIFPEKLKNEYDLGYANIEIELGEDGVPTHFKTNAATHPLFAEASIAALKKSEFVGATKNGKSTAVRIIRTFIFEN